MNLHGLDSPHILIQSYIKGVIGLWSFGLFISCTRTPYGVCCAELVGRCTDWLDPRTLWTLMMLFNSVTSTLLYTPIHFHLFLEPTRVHNPDSFVQKEGLNIHTTLLSIFRHLNLQVHWQSLITIDHHPQPCNFVNRLSGFLHILQNSTSPTFTRCCRKSTHNLNPPIQIEIWLPKRDQERDQVSRYDA